MEMTTFLFVFILVSSYFSGVITGLLLAFIVGLKAYIDKLKGGD